MDEEETWCPEELRWLSDQARVLLGWLENGGHPHDGANHHDDHRGQHGQVEGEVGTTAWMGLMTALELLQKEPGARVSGKRGVTRVFGVGGGGVLARCRVEGRRLADEEVAALLGGPPPRR